MLRHQETQLRICDEFREELTPWELSFIDSMLHAHRAMVESGNRYWLSKKQSSKLLMIYDRIVDHSWTQSKKQ